MILDNIPENVVADMRLRLCMEGVFNRDSELLQLRIRMKEVATTQGKILERLRMLMLQFDCAQPDLEEIRRVAKSSGWEKLEKIHQDLQDANQEMSMIYKEMDELIDERANR